MAEKLSLDCPNNLRETSFGGNVPKEDVVVEDEKNKERKKLVIKIDWEKVREGIRNPEDVGLGYRCLYRNEFAKGLELGVFKYEEEGPISFVISKKNSGTEVVVAEFIFDFLPDLSLLDLRHRLVTVIGMESGIDGDNFLLEAENYLRNYLEETKQKDEYSDFGINAGQVSVIKWARHNGYYFEDRMSDQLYESILRGDSKDVVITDDFKETNGSYGNYIVEKTKLEELKEKNPKDVLIFQHSLRFGLVKDIWPKEEVTEGEK